MQLRPVAAEYTSLLETLHPAFRGGGLLPVQYSIPLRDDEVFGRYRLTVDLGEEFGLCAHLSDDFITCIWVYAPVSW